jgi:hypothetical protein
VQGAGNFVRAQVRLDVRKPLPGFVSMSCGDQREVYQIKYEKVPCFRVVCGKIVHSHVECGTVEFEEDKLKWGDWLKADWDTWHDHGFGGSRGGCRACQGGAKLKVHVDKILVLVEVMMEEAKVKGI